MSIKFTCDDKQTLVSYLYGEVDHETRQAVDAHLDTCAACAAEVIALGDARSGLGMWVPPDVELDFKIVKKSELPPANVLRPARWWNTVPAWAQAAAAILVLAAGAAIANVQVKSGPEGFSVSTGWMPFDSSTASSARGALAQDRQPDEAWKAALASLEQQLRNEIRSTREQETRVAARTPVDEATIRRVQQMIAASEQRHERELAMRFIEFT
ncbi:MAG TPA: zf-HC2 domain-containing protein, partial [Vicinamibacterales bacterium]|nr:zf-HC2 domain-containing protein [Vicinamibacterales bacterium]